MKYLNNKISLFLFLLIKVVCVTYGNLQNCIDELLVEFKNRDPMDDFLIAFLNIEYISTDYSYQTGNNEELYRGNYDLTFAARGYYLEMYYILQDMDLPLLMSPQDYCRITHINEERDCISDIAKIGCGANKEGFKCLKYLYRRWKQTLHPDTTPGTEYLSDKRLLEAIYTGYEQFRNLSDEEWIEEFYSNPQIMNNLSDGVLLTNSGFVPLEIPASSDSYDYHFRNNSRMSRYEIVTFEQYKKYLVYSNYRYIYSPRNYGASSYDYDEYTSYTTQSSYNYDQYNDIRNQMGYFNNPESSGSSSHDNPSSSDRQNFEHYTKYRSDCDYESDFIESESNSYRDYSRYKEYMQHLQNVHSDEYMRSEPRRRRNYERRRMFEAEINSQLEAERNSRIEKNKTLRENHLRNARFEKFGIADASYLDICKEYIRRKNTTRSFDYYYTMYIYDTLNDSSCGGVLKNCTDFCETYVSQ